MNIVLWIVQILLALLYLFSGVMKFVLPYEKMTEGQKVVLPHWFLLFIGVCEILGGLGLVLPWLLKIRPGLTPLAAWLLLIIMIGAVIVSAMTAVTAAIPGLVAGALLIFVGWGRSRSSAA